MKRVKSFQEIQEEKSDEAMKKHLLKDIPMMTRDEKEICLNSILYSYRYKSGYGWKGLGSVEVTAYRVIYIDNSRRFFRLRCIKGCETEVSMKNECDSAGYYALLSSIEKEVKPEIEHDIKKGLKKIDEIEKTIKKLKQEQSSIRGTRILIPKSVRP